MSLIIGKENKFSTETLIYETGDEIQSISYIISGSVRLETETDTQIIEANSFIAVGDLYEGFYSGDYYALKDCEIMVFSADNIFSLVDYFNENPELHKRYYKELCSLLRLLYNQYETLYSEITNIYQSLDTTYNRYLQCCSLSGVTPSDFLMVHDSSLYKFSEQSFAKNYMIFLNCYELPEQLDALYTKNPTAFLRQQLNVIRSLYTTYEDMLFYLKTEISLFASNSQDCLFYIVASLMESVTESQSHSVMNLLNDMKNIITNMDTQIKESVGITLDIDYNRVNFYFMMASNATFKEEPVTNDNTAAPSSPITDLDWDFSDSLSSLCQYSQMDNEFYNELKALIQFYIDLDDKSVSTDSVRIFRRNLSELYFELYEKVFFAYIEDSSQNKLAELFLDFGFLDHRLLTDSQIEMLAKLDSLNDCSPCKVYRMSQWLSAIYNGEKLPSKNEFDQDYIEFIRERKKNEHLSPADEAKLLNDRVEMIKFEIKNVVKYGCRIVSGNILAFTPMLSMYDFDGELDKLVLTSKAINSAVKDCLAADFSAFYREQIYSNPEKKISKEVIQLEVFPDMILFPVYGTKAVMWQDLSGKRSNTPGRFFLPSFFRGNINDTMISLIGRFRWELCKSLMGISWNNLSVPSLTSEYTDYIQFYRKNRELSSDKKEALKSQISKCRNNTREVFTSDYFAWIKYESAGAIRLNKVVRRMLSTYCPFSKDLRDKLEKMPMYEESLKRFNIQRQKKAAEISNRIRALERAGADITQEIYDTEAFYSL